jgi:3-hydroxybutyryl-CoA dehydratase
LTYTYEDLKKGVNYTHEIEITSHMVSEFAKLTGDDNPIHLDDEIAEMSIFGRRIAHGLLSASLFSMVLGSHFPGPGTIILSMDIKFKAPVYVDEQVRLLFKIKETTPERKRLIIETICEDMDGQRQIEGKVMVLFDK